MRKNSKGYLNPATQEYVEAEPPEVLVQKADKGYREMLKAMELGTDAPAPEPPAPPVGLPHPRLRWTAGRLTAR